MSRKNTRKSFAVAVAACALAASLAGCCLFGSDSDRCKTCGESCCCCCRDSDGGSADAPKKHGANVSMTFGIGTDGIHAGGDANVGSHGASVNANADADMGGVTVGADAGVH